jgi:NAD(P)-dependent dehydrogenase (short-subunit alcohol dehydrogenase family)
MSAMELHGKIALVTGASRGIGAAIAEALALEGVHVILVARSSLKLEAVEAKIHAAGGTATIAPLDLTQSENIEKLSQAVQSRWGKLDIMVLNAAQLGALSPVVHIEAKDLAKTIALNFVAQQQLIAHFDPLLRASPAGRVIGLTSSAGSNAYPFWGAYGASKAAFDIMLGCYAQEVEKLAPVRVAILDPGRTRTEMRRLAYPGEDPASLKTPDVVAQQLLNLLHQDFATGHKERVEVIV